MPAAVAAPKPVQRLDSLSRPGRGILRGTNRKPTKQAPKCCDSPSIVDEDGSKICQNCGTQISEANIAAEVSFGEDTRGAATVQGGFVGENARHARTLGTAAFRRVGGGEKDSMAEIESNGRRELTNLCPRLQVMDDVKDQAQGIWKLAAMQNFTAGRRTQEVVAACLYAACRRQRDNTILLIDISELIQVNVFRLGEVYKDLLKALYLEDKGHPQQMVDVEPLIMKYCRKLEFGEMTKQVAEDAVRIIRRMKRDWIVTGRHPAGLCGACIILAARMNNFRRTVREVVFIAKVADVTVMKRLEEFKRTRASTLTVDEFRSVGVRLKVQHDPPIVYETKLKARKAEERKRKRQDESDDTIEISDDGSNASSRASSVAAASPAPEGSADGAKRKKRRTSKAQPTPPATQEPRIDADGFAIPALPIDPTLMAASEPEPPKSKRGRPRKDQTPAPPPLSAADLAFEDELEREIQQSLNDPKTTESVTEVEQAKVEAWSTKHADDQRALDAANAKQRRAKQGITWWDDKEAPGGDILAHELEAEFQHDPEVENCLLTPKERTKKEKIWVAMNEDWLRNEQVKISRKKLEAAEALAKKQRGAKAKKKKRGKVGDGSLMADAETPAETPADANMMMLNKRAPPSFSKHINYEALKGVYGTNRSSTSGSRASSVAPAGSEAGSPTREGTPATTVDTAERESASPAPARQSVSAGLVSPPTTQQATTQATEDSSGLRSAFRDAQRTPPPTQEQAAAGAENEEGDDYDEDMDDEVEEEMEYGGGRRDFGEESDREDIGEDDFQNAVDPTSRIGLQGDYFDDDGADY